MKQKLSKEERLALVKAGREERGKYQARAAIKQKKVRYFILFALKLTALGNKMMFCLAINAYPPKTSS